MQVDWLSFIFGGLITLVTCMAIFILFIIRAGLKGLGKK